VIFPKEELAKRIAKAIDSSTTGLTSRNVDRDHIVPDVPRIPRRSFRSPSPLIELLLTSARDEHVCPFLDEEICPANYSVCHSVMNDDFPLQLPMLHVLDYPNFNCHEPIR